MFPPKGLFIGWSSHPLSLEFSAGGRQVPRPPALAKSQTRASSTGPGGFAGDHAGLQGHEHPLCCSRVPGRAHQTAWGELIAGRGSLQCFGNKCPVTLTPDCHPISCPRGQAESESGRNCSKCISRQLTGCSDPSAGHGWTINMGDCLIEIQMPGPHPWTLTKQEVGLNQELSEVSVASAEGTCR